MKSIGYILVAALLSGSASISILAVCPKTAMAEDTSSLEDLYFIEQAARRIRARLKALRGSADASPEEIAEHERYLQQLEAQIRAAGTFEKRPTRTRAGQRRPVVPPVGAAPPIPVVPEATESDDVAAYDRKLHESLAIFDDMLLQEVETATEESSMDASAGSGGGGARVGSAGGASGGQSGSTQGSSQSNSEGTTTRDRTSQQRTATQTGVGGKIIESGTGSKASRGGASGRRGRIPPDIPDGRDDDVVARQIREAAEAESDPALREKLWDEYRRYKKGESS